MTFLSLGALFVKLHNGAAVQLPVLKIPEQGHTFQYMYKPYSCGPVAKTYQYTLK
jgi:hypothetical protein